MDKSSTDLISSRESHVSEEQLDNKQNESQLQNQGQTSASEKIRPTVEPLLLLILIAEIIPASVTTNFLELQSCKTVLNISVAECSNMSSETESKVQVVTADLQMWKSLLEGLLPAFLSFFVGPWSDANGRRLLFLASTFGLFCYHSAWVILSLLPSLPLSYYLLASFPKAFSGGLFVLFIASYCYMVDITRTENRTFRIGIMEAASSFGLGLGYFLSPIIFKFGFPYVFGTSAIICFICFLYSYFYLEETIKPEGSISYNILNWQHPFDLISTTFSKRPNNGRIIVLLVVGSFFISILIFLGELSVYYLWTKLKFHWDLRDFTQFQMFGALLYGLGSIGCLWVFTSKVHLPDLPIATVITSFRIFASVILAFATASWQVYAASFVSIFSGAVSPLLRSTISKIIPKHEVGKVFSLISSLEAMGPLAASPLYTNIYDSTINCSVSVIFLVSASLHTVIILCFIITMIIQWRSPAVEYSSFNDGIVEA